ncbi:MAG: hypothetical protein PHC80_09205, partial [Eubacteriales bacterium]|nr:hypothetical protein [Eubacteriales bacterium]
MRKNSIRRPVQIGVCLLTAFLLYGLEQVLTQNQTLMRYSLHVVSAFALLCIILFCYFVYCLSGVRLSRPLGWIIAAASVLCCLMYTFVALHKPMLYYFDSTIYYRSVLELRLRYTANPVNVFQLCKIVYDSIFTMSYPYIITAFSAFPFVFTNLSAEAYILCTAYAVVPMLL